MIVSSCRKIWYPKCWNQLVETLMFICIQKVNFISNFFFEIFLRHWKVAILGTLGMLDHSHQNILVSICSKLSCSSPCKKSTALLTSFLTCCREIANLLFWVIWACLATNTYNDCITLKKPSTYISRQNINFILLVFLEILQRYCKLVVFSTLDMSRYAHPEWYYHLVENFCVYLQAKNQLHPPYFYGNVAKICKLILGALSMTEYHLKW